MTARKVLGRDWRDWLADLGILAGACIIVGMVMRELVGL